MERLGQGHLHPKLEVHRLTCLGRESNPGLRGGGELSSKDLYEQRIFNQFFGFFLPSLIRIQPTKIEAKFRIHPDLDPDLQHCFIVNDIVAHTRGNMKFKV